jgi:hypothetical protein
MRPLLSTRLLTATCCSAEGLRLAREAGFPSLELRSDSVGGDLFRGGEAERIFRLVTAQGDRIAWLQVDAAIAGKLGDPALRIRFRDALGRLRLEGVSVTDPIPGGNVGELLTAVELAGARLCLEREAFSAAELSRWPRAVELGWDLSPAAAIGAGPRDLDRFLGPVPAGRLLAVRVSGRDEAGRRIPPGEREAILLEETWRRYRPEYVVYDVEDPSGFGAATSLDHVLAELRSFHTGGKHPHAVRPWGLFGSA